MPRRTSDTENPSATSSRPPPDAASPPVRDAGRARAERDAARDGREIAPSRGAGIPRQTAAEARLSGVPGRRPRGGGKRPAAGPDGKRAVGRKIANTYISAVGASSVRIPGTDAAPNPSRNKIHSILSALPLIMLIAGLWTYYSNERAQSYGSPILAESVAARGVFDGLSVVNSGGDGRHYLWFDDGTRKRGARIRAYQREALASLEPGDDISLQLAPTVSGSRTLWAWRVERDGVRLIDAAADSNR